MNAKGTGAPVAAAQKMALKAALDRILERLGADELDAALDLCRDLLDRHPEQPDALHLAGFIHQMRGEHEDAVHYFAHAQQVAPENVEVLNNFAASLKALGRYERAERYYREVIERNPDFVLAQHNFADLLLTLDRPAEATARARAAIRIDPGFSNAYLTLGRALSEQRRDDEAIEAYREAVARGAPLAVGEMAESLLLLLRGRYAQGWEKYEARLVSPDGSTPPLSAAVTSGYPRWRGSMLTRRAILVREEQGLGDELMFASCMPDLISTAGRCVLVCSPGLLALFARSFPGVEVLAADDPDLAHRLEAARIDFQVPCGSLPLAFRTRAEDFPAHEGYLRADPARVAYWRERLDALGDGPKIGLSWRGGTPGSGRERRSIPLAELQSALASRAHFISLQYGPVEDELAGQARAGYRVEHWPEVIADTDETAALITALDLTLSVCTAVVHLAGALGRPAWVMTPWAAEWRYGDSGENLIWYPSVRLFRQPVPGDWESVVRQVDGALRERYPA